METGQYQHFRLHREFTSISTLRRVLTTLVDIALSPSDRSIQRQQPRGDQVGLTSKCRQEAIVVLVVGADARGPQPSCYGPSFVGEEDDAVLVADVKEQNTP